VDSNSDLKTLDQASLDLLNADINGAPLSDTDKSRIKNRLFSRIRSSTLSEATTIRAKQGSWLKINEKVSVKILRQDSETNSQTALWKLDAGATIPSHTHPVEEECYIISGSVNFDGHQLNAGDFEIFPAGLDHGEMQSVSGALIMLRSDISQDLSWIG